MTVAPLHVSTKSANSNIVPLKFQVAGFFSHSLGLFSHRLGFFSHGLGFFSHSLELFSHGLGFRHNNGKDSAATTEKATKMIAIPRFLPLKTARPTHLTLHPTLRNVLKHIMLSASVGNVGN